MADKIKCDQCNKTANISFIKEDGITQKVWSCNSCGNWGDAI